MTKSTARAAPAQAAELLPFHPLADMFPLMEGAEFDALVKDIEAHGLEEDMTLYEGKILDGRNRYLACLKVRPEDALIDGGRVYQFTGDYDEARAFVISKNLYRRHLTAEQQAEWLVKIVAAQPEKSNRKLADETGVTHPTIAKARRQAEATGKTLPVGKRTGADGKRRRQPIRAAKKPEAKALVWKTRGQRVLGKNKRRSLRDVQVRQG